MEIVINDNNLLDNEIEEFGNKVRAILVDSNNQILVASYFDTLLLPGGKVDNLETNTDAIIRELEEEIGEIYQSSELTPFLKIKFYQKKYPKVNGEFKNRLLTTNYFIGPYKEISNTKQKLSEREKRGNFHLQLIPLEEIKNTVLKNSINNPRNIYFQKELLLVIENYISLQEKSDN